MKKNKEIQHAIAVAEQSITIIAPTNKLPKKITSEAAMHEVIQVAKQCKALLAELEQKKQDYIAPIKKGVLKLEADLRAARKPLEQTHKKAKELIAGFLLRSNQKEVAKAQRKVDKNPTVANNEALQIAKEICHVQTPSGVTVKQPWTYEIVDENLIPAYLTLPDSGTRIELRKVQGSALKSVAKLGSKAPKIPGVVFKQTVEVAI